MASEPTLFLFTTARSADCIRRLRRRCDWRLFGGNYARLASGSPQMQTIQGIPARHAADWRIMSKEENRLNFRMSPETAEKLEHWYRQDGCRSKNEFLERAVNYYADHLAAGTSTMLPRAVQSAIDGRLQLLEQRLSSLLFKQAVELDMGLSLLAECVNLDESVLRKQRAKSVNDVKRTNGQLRLEQKLRALGAEKKVLLVLPENDQVLVRSARNIPGVKTAQVSTLNTYDVINADKFIVVKDAVARIEEVYA